MLESLLLLIASFVIQVALAPATSSTQSPPATADDFDFPQSDEGTPQAVFFGECWSSDWTVLAVGDYRNEAITSSVGKK